MPARSLDAVLPLRARDYGRFQILDRSLRRNFRDLNRCWVVTMDAEECELRSRIGGPPYRVLPESAIVPEIAAYRALYRGWYATTVGARIAKGRYDATGWFVQQLVKLAISDRVESEFYLTLDADVICMKPVGYDDLVESGRAIANLRSEDVHPDWYASAERILGQRRSGRTHGVTPAVLARDAVHRLRAFLATRVGERARRLGSLFPQGSRMRDLFCSWRSHLLRNTPWTEYALYFTFLESTGAFDTFHVARGPDAIYDNARSVWFERDFANAPLEAFMHGPAPFWVVQSNTHIPPDRVWEKVRPYLE